MHPKAEHLEVVVFTPNRRLRLGPANPPRLLRAVLEQVHWISLEELSQQPNLDPLLNLLTPPLRPPQRSHHRPDPGAAAGAAGSPGRCPARLPGPGRPGRVAGRQPLKRVVFSTVQDSVQPVRNRARHGLVAACGGCPSERPHRPVSHREPGGGGVRDYIHVMDLAEGHRANPCGYVIDEE